MSTDTAIHDPPKQLSIITGSLAGPIKCELAPEVEERIQATITCAKGVTQVNSPEELALSTDRRGELQRWRIDLTNDKREVKRPANDWLARIEETYQKALAAIAAEEQRLIQLSNTYAKKLQDEQDRQRERQRRDDEKAQQEVSRLHAEAERAEARGDKDKAAQKLFEAATLEPEAPAPIVNPKVRVKVDLDFDIAGATEREQLKNTLLFASRFPHLCDFKPKRGIILTMLNSNGFADCGEKDGMPDVPGLRVFEKLKSRIRTPR
jgi:hypothetical protein